MALSDLQPLTVPGSQPATSPINGYHPLQACVAQITGKFYVIPAEPLTGGDLITHCKRFPNEFASKSDLVAASGHLKEGGKLNFISFYETLLAAKTEADPNYGNNIDEDNEYDNLSEDQKALYDYIADNYGSKWNHDETIEFMGELKDLGIETVNHHENAFYTFVDDGYHWEREFAEELVCELEHNLTDSLAYHAIDWQRVWDSSLTYDYSTIEFDDSVFIFHANW
jgi:hypothetical protein